MADNKVLYAIRMPRDLKALLESEAKKQGKRLTEFVIEACWSYLEEPPPSDQIMRSVTQPVLTPDQAASPVASLMAIPGVMRANDIGTPVADAVKARSLAVKAASPDGWEELSREKMRMENMADMATLPAMHPSQAVFDSFSERPMCSYKEYDQDTGETYACALRQHPGKIKHQRGQVVS